MYICILLKCIYKVTMIYLVQFSMSTCLTEIDNNYLTIYYYLKLLDLGKHF
jgi:hypothetical protein